jgi:DNA-directed RNA polymerase I subunit RPA1
MSSGRTLPSFAPFDVNPRADGFVMDRFLTGIRPQEYYFHCMAGREGLVDTAVKTSRSGYLQRCLVKHLEEVKVCYDYTVRNGEGGVLQFLYGEDGIDPTKASYLDCSDTSFVYMARNSQSLEQGQVALPGATIELASVDAERNEEVQKTTEERTILNVGDFVLARRLRFGNKWARGALCEGWFDAKIIEKDNKGETFHLEYLKDGHNEKNVHREVNFGRNSTLSSSCQLIKPAAADPIVSSCRPSHRLGTSGACVSERLALAASTALKTNVKLQQVLKANKMSASKFGALVAAKYGAALCAPGEAVGSIAAQSVGEPSTQMTLNTFHLGKFRIQYGNQFVLFHNVTDFFLVD